MKKLINTMIGLVIVALLVNLAIAAGSVNQMARESRTKFRGSMLHEYLIYATGDTGDGSYPATNVGDLYGHIQKVVSIPSYGNTNPSVNWDYTLTDEDGIDLLGGGGADRNRATSEAIAISSIPVAGPVTLTVTGNTAVGAHIKFRLYLEQ